MRRIGITGGKGGTGKSTFALLLANELIQKNKKVVLVDADVECPNLALIAGYKKGKEEKRIYASFPQLDKTKCRRCGLCAQKCPFSAIFQAKNQYPIFFEELCGACGLCWEVCPFGAIKPKKKLTG
ncbi:4Fe-4S binding protein, partial [bacterium]|nr:4Fe-4S binding protein [bacterium]